jgi:hypothetical protein
MLQLKHKTKALSPPSPPSAQWKLNPREFHISSEILQTFKEEFFFVVQSVRNGKTCLE